MPATMRARDASENPRLLAVPRPCIEARLMSVPYPVPFIGSFRRMAHAAEQEHYIQYQYIIKLQGAQQCARGFDFIERRILGERLVDLLAGRLLVAGFMQGDAQVIADFR